MFAQTLTDSQRPDLQISEQVKVENHGPALAESYILSSPVVQEVVLFMEDRPNATSMRAIKQMERGDLNTYPDIDGFREHLRDL